ncbi:thiamine phosphate synthase [[Clostridium] dakarense]|uniref:thiamine phosphate synthase n=1 Tax=Faecalimicrobium dakarense TaxID=1301100 RepID=UPI0004AC6BDB|nr:thiamine phosphate synthase [[Clostridium] dakarense]
MFNKEKLKEYLKLYLVTDSEILKNRDFYESIEDAIKGGVKILQLREKKCIR